MTLDLLSLTSPMRVRLDRTVDRQKPCCGNVAVIRPGKGPHAAELRCESCAAHRGWLRAEALTFIETLARQFSAPVEPLILRDTTIGDYQMTTERQYDNTGILFRNEDKTGEREPDYRGRATIDGREFQLAGWIKTGKRGKFLTIAVKPKEPTDEKKPKPSMADEMSDEIPF